MNRLCGVALVLSGAFATSETLSEFSAPWSDATNAIVIDPYKQNAIDWDTLATDARVVAVKTNCELRIKN
jgi:hypothetical protein